MAQFQYQPLDRTKSEIRLVQLLPTLKYDDANVSGINDTLSIRCHLWHVSLDENLMYTGLSYVWGNATRTKPISVYEPDVSSRTDVAEGPKKFFIPENLYDALISLREPKEPLTLWIDAICINQDDNEEKSWQVQQMARVFSIAFSVIAWLGQAADDSDLLFDQLSPIIFRALVDCPQILNHLSRPTLAVEKWHRLLIKREPCTTDEGLEKVILDYADFESNSKIVLWRAMRSFTNRPWWRRIWIIQEFALAKSVQFACGTKRCAVNDLWGFYNVIGFFFDGFTRCRHTSVLAMDMWFEPPLGRCSALMFLYRYAAGTTDWSFADLLMSLGDAEHARSTFEASDPRDIIFALLQVDPDLHQVPIVVDYSMSCTELYIAVAHYLIRSCNANVLRYSQVPKLVKDLPSWVPDWSSPLRPPNDLGSYTPELGATSASATMRQSWTDQQLQNGSILSVRGVSVGQILNVVGPHPNIEAVQESEESMCEPLNMDNIRAWLREAYLCSQLAFNLRANSQQAVHDTGETPLDLTLKTILPIAERDLVNTWQKYQKLITVGIQSLLDSDFASSNDKAHFFAHFWSSIVSRCARRRLYVTSNGYFGLGPDHMRPSDKVVIIYGVDTPVIIRQLENLNFELIGQTYIDELMEGQFMSKDSPTEIFNHY